jgi:hypothetical protein
LPHAIILPLHPSGNYESKTMKHSLTILSLALLTLAGCSKSGPSPTKPTNPTNPNNPTNPTNPSGSSVTITSVASETTAAMYADDGIVITGTGFNADKTKDTVVFGFIYDNEFNPYSSTSGGHPAATTITSATATQLKINAQDPVSLNFEAQYDDPAKSPPAVAVYANGKVAYTKITLAPIITIVREEDDDKPRQSVDNTYPGDTLQLICSGVIPAGTSLTVNGKDLTYTVTTFTNSGGTLSTLYAFLTPNFFGGSNVDTASTVSRLY